MVNVAISRKKLVAVAAGVAAAAMLAVVPAYAFYYVHGNAYDAGSSVNGAVEVVVTIDGSARGESSWTQLVCVPASESTPAAAVEQAIVSSNSQNGVAAIHNYDYRSVRDYVANGTWTCTVYSAADRKAGTHTTQDGSGKVVSDLAGAELQRFDQVVLTAS